MDEPIAQQQRRRELLIWLSYAVIVVLAMWTVLAEEEPDATYSTPPLDAAPTAENAEADPPSAGN